MLSAYCKDADLLGRRFTPPRLTATRMMRTPYNPTFADTLRAQPCPALRTGSGWLEHHSCVFNIV